MALLQQQTVNFTDHSPFHFSNTDELMTLSQVSSGLNLPIYASASPFIVEDEILRKAVDNAATLTPQPLSVIIDEQTHNQTPDLMWSIQAYCAHHNEAMQLDTMEIASMQADASAQLSATATVLLEAGDVVIVMGSEPLLISVIDASLNLPGKTIIYIPTNIEDQFKLHQILSMKQHCTVIPIVNTDVLDTTDIERSRAITLQMVELAMNDNTDLMPWMEEGISSLTTLSGAALLDLLPRYLSAATNNTQYLLAHDAEAISSLVKAASNHLTVTDAMALLIAINSRAMVIAEHLPKGTDNRVCALLQALGCTLHFDNLNEQAAKLSKGFVNSHTKAAVAQQAEFTSSTMASPTLTASHYGAAIAWVDKNYQHNPH